MKVEPQQLKAFMVDADLISDDKFDKLLKETKENNRKISELLVEKGIVSEEKLARLKAYILGIPFVDLKKEEIDSEVLKIIPEPIARNHNIVSFRKKGKKLEVAMLDPADIKTIDFIKKKSHLKILPRLTTKKSIKKVLSQYQESLQSEFGEIIDKEAEEIKNLPLKKKEKADEKDLKKKAEQLPIIRIVDTLLKHAIYQRASDIHVEPTEKEVIVRYRIDGVLHDAMTLPLNTKSGIVARIKVLAHLKLDEHRLPQDGRFKIEKKGEKYSCRVSILPVFNGEKVVLRLLSETAEGFTLEELGLRGNDLEKVQTALNKPVGMLLVTGPTGSGKTTTLYSMMDILSTPEVNISTVEDPVEYRMKRVNQTQVNPDIGFSFAEGLRSLLRQDPDILMVGEIRDKETASLAINAALTGHLLLSTLHTNSAAGTIPRFLDMGAKPFLLSSTINVIIAQRLVRKLCEERKKYKLNDSQLKALGKYCNLKKVKKLLREQKLLEKNQDLQDIWFYKPKPSEESEEGYKGRIGIFEVLEISETVKELIQKGANSDKIQKQAQEEGMKLMIEDGIIKAARGITSIEEILRVTTE